MTENLFELWWAEYMPDATQARAWAAYSAALPPDEPVSVPDDFRSHKSAWRNALSQCARSAKGTDDESYWAHELAAFDRAYAELGA